MVSIEKHNIMEETAKRKGYIKPAIEEVRIDNEISLVMTSVGP